jgi:hypothetical protein
MDDGDADDECEDACRLLCGTICSSSLQVHSRWSRWHRLQIGFVSQHFTFLLRHVRQPGAHEIGMVSEGISIWRGRVWN